MPSVRLAVPEREGRGEGGRSPTSRPSSSIASSATSSRRRTSASTRSTRRSSRSSSRTTCAASISSASSSTRSARSSRAASASLGWQVGLPRGARAQPVLPRSLRGRRPLLRPLRRSRSSVERFATSAAFKVFVPAFVIVLISLLGMWVPPNEMEVRSNAGAPMLAAAVLFHFALMQELPATSYLTRADKLMLGVYVSLALGMLSTWCDVPRQGTARRAACSASPASSCRSSRSS